MEDCTQNIENFGWVTHGYIMVMEFLPGGINWFRLLFCIFHR